MPRFVFDLFQSFFHNRLGGDTGMIRPRHPQRHVTLHTVHPNLDILECVVESMSQVQSTGNIGRWDNDRERFFGLVDVRVEAAVLKPLVINLRCARCKIEAIGNFVWFSVHLGSTGLNIG